MRHCREHDWDCYGRRPKRPGRELQPARRKHHRVAALTIELDPKRLELLHELAPSGGLLAVLLNPSRSDMQIQLDGIKTAARSLGRELVLGYANTI